jgi:transposase
MRLEVQELKELQRQGMSFQGISKLTGWDRKTIRKYLQQPSALPEYGPRQAQASKLDPFKPYLEERMRAGVWNVCVLRPKRAKRRRWAPLRPRPRRQLYRLQGWGIFDRRNGESSSGFDKKKPQ